MLYSQKDITALNSWLAGANVMSVNNTDSRPTRFIPNVNLAIMRFDRFTSNAEDTELLQPFYYAAIKKIDQVILQEMVYHFYALENITPDITADKIRNLLSIVETAPIDNSEALADLFISKLASIYDVDVTSDAEQWAIFKDKLDGLFVNIIIMRQYKLFYQDITYDQVKLLLKEIISKHTTVIEKQPVMSPLLRFSFNHFFDIFAAMLRHNNSRYCVTNYYTLAAELEQSTTIDEAMQYFPDNSFFDVNNKAIFREESRQHYSKILLSFYY